MAIDVPIVSAPPKAVPFKTTSEFADFEQRWAAWQAKGAAHDRAIGQRLAVVAPILIIAAATVMYWLLGR